jgi:hypothetical protein
MSNTEIAQALFSRMLAIRANNSQVTTKAWDESKYKRQGKGSDKGGEFAPKGGGSVSFVAPAIDDPSGSIERDTTKAIRQLDGERHANQKRIMEDIDAQLGITSTHLNAVGVWSDGAENSLTIHSEGVDHETLKYATAIKAQIARQKDAIAFTPAKDGNAYLYTVSVKDTDISALRKAATDNGLAYHTIHEDGKNGSKIIVFDPSGSGELDDTVSDFAEKVDAYEASRDRGHGEFLTEEYNSRSKASAKHDAIIAEYEKANPDKRHYRAESGQERFDNRRGESTKGLTVGHAQVARALFTRAAELSRQNGSLTEQQQKTASAIFSRAWDETKIVRHGKGDDRGGEFAPKGGGQSSGKAPTATKSGKPSPGKQEPSTKPTAEKKPQPNSKSPSVKPKVLPAGKPVSDKAKASPAKETPEAAAAAARLAEIKKNLPENFRMSVTNDRTVVTPDGTYVTLPENPADALNMMEDLLNDNGHNAKTFLQDAKLKAIGADFLDDLEPDEDGNLFQTRQSSASYSVENTAPQSWDDVDSYTQNGIEESWRDSMRMDLENDRDFYEQVRTEAEETADAEIDGMDNADLAAEIEEELKGMNGYEEATTDEIEAMLDSGDRTAQELRDAYVIQRRDELIDEMMEGEFYSDRLTDSIQSSEDNMDGDDWFRYAEEGGYFENSDEGSNEDVERKLADMGLDIEDLTTMMGAPDDWHFEITYDSEHDGVQCSYEDGKNIMTRVFHTNEDGELAVYNSHFKLARNAPKGLGLEIFSQAVAACKEQGVVEFKTHAAGSYRNTGPDDYVGYAVWPTFGYSFPVDKLNSDTRSKVADAYPDAEDVRDIFDQPGGQAWWWKNGSSLYNYEGDETTYAHFDLREGSRSLAALNSYMSRKKAERQKVRQSAAK